MSAPLFTMENFKNVMSSVLPYAAAPAAAAVAVVPVFHGFVVKTDLQLGNKVTPFHPFYALRTAVKAAPGVGGTVGAQLMATMAVDKVAQVATGNPPSVASAFGSGFAVAVATSPLLAGVAGTTAGKGFVESMRNITVPQVKMVTKREVPFLGMNAASGPVGTIMQQRFGKTKKVEYAATALCNGVGAAAGHVHDTLFQLSLDKQTLAMSSKEFQRRALQSGIVRVPVVATFGCLYKATKEAISS